MILLLYCAKVSKLVVIRSKDLFNIFMPVKYVHSIQCIFNINTIPQFGESQKCEKKKKVLHDILLCYIFTGLFSGIQLLIISQLSQFIRVTDLMHISATSMHFESLHCRAAQTIGK